MSFGLRTAEIDPGRPSGRALGLKNAGFAPERASERGAEGAFGLGNAKSDPGRAAERGLRIRMTDFEPGKALRWGWRGVFRIKNCEIDPGRSPKRECLGHMSTKTRQFEDKKSKNQRVVIS